MVINNRGKRQVLHHDRLRCCHDNNVPLWARRERRKLEAESTEGGKMGMRFWQKKIWIFQLYLDMQRQGRQLQMMCMSRGDSGTNRLLHKSLRPLLSFRPVASVVAADDNRPGYAIVSLTVELCACSAWLRNVCLHVLYVVCVFYVLYVVRVLYVLYVDRVIYVLYVICVLKRCMVFAKYMYICDVGFSLSYMYSLCTVSV